MASSGKKGKKSKGTVISLQSFLSNGDVPAGTTQVAKNIRNVDGEDSDEGGKVLTVVCQLPTAPRANRIFDDNSIPHKSPFIAYVTNLPFDVREEDIYEYFKANHVSSVRLPREDGDTGRVRGFGYVEFESRDDLIQSLGILDPTIKGRRVRIDVSNENESNSRQRGARRGYDTINTNSDVKESTNWRRDNNPKRDSYNFGVERNFNRDQKSMYDELSSPGSWRQKNSSNSAIASSLEQVQQKDRDNYLLQKNTSERPKLLLKPRTLPLPELDVPLKITLESKINDINSSNFAGTSTEKVFGSAKPVDTTARDLEIEERLADVRRQDNLHKDILKTVRDLDELKIAKDEKITNRDQNWRRQNANDDIYYKIDKKSIKSDKRNENSRDNRKKYQDKSEGSDVKKYKDGKRKDVVRNKRELKTDRQIFKHTQSQSEQAVQSSNKYSGLDEVSD